MANRRYLAFAEQSDQDGLPQIARLFRAAAHAETIHAMNHLKALGEIKSTAENLQAAINGENYKVINMYPQCIKDAEEEAQKRPLTGFKWAFEVEKVHEALYPKALKMLDGEIPETDYYVCPFCGAAHGGLLDRKCPVCGTPRERFTHID